MYMDTVEVFNTLVVPFAQLLIAVVLGAVIGIERSLAGKTAGMRTYALVAMAGALFIIIPNLLPAHIEGDILRFPGAIITGIGFLGAGLIIFREEKATISGLTTAAGLWISAGIGMAVGYGLYILAIFTAVITLFVFTVLWDIEYKVVRFAKRKNIYGTRDFD